MAVWDTPGSYAFAVQEATRDLNFIGLKTTKRAVQELTRGLALLGLKTRKEVFGPWLRASPVHTRSMPTKFCWYVHSPARLPAHNSRRTQPLITPQHCHSTRARCDVGPRVAPLAMSWSATSRAVFGSGPARARQADAPSGLA